MKESLTILYLPFHTKKNLKTSKFLILYRFILTVYCIVFVAKYGLNVVLTLHIFNHGGRSAILSLVQDSAQFDSPQSGIALSSTQHSPGQRSA